MNKFESQIAAFNKMYGLRPIEPDDARERLNLLKKILEDEVSEIFVIQLLADCVNHPKDFLSLRTELADLLGDLIVYAASEMQRWEIPMEGVLDIIMESNASKLGEDGKPIISEGKVQKGPGYWKPEPRIKELLARR